MVILKAHVIMLKVRREEVNRLFCHFVFREQLAHIRRLFGGTSLSFF